MKLVLEIAYDDNTFIGFSSDEAVAEAMIVERFKEVGSEGSELIRIEYNDQPVYSIRSKFAEPEDDGFEYVDNEGNTINADGSDFIESDDLVIEEDKYEYSADFLWVIRDGQEGNPVNIASSEYYLVNTGPTNPFEENEDLVVISTL
jgi:hypothetical protein